MTSVRGVKKGSQKYCVGLHKCVAPSGAYARKADLSNYFWIAGGRAAGVQRGPALCFIWITSIPGKAWTHAN